MATGVGEVAPADEAGEGQAVPLVVVRVQASSARAACTLPLLEPLPLLQLRQLPLPLDLPARLADAPIVQALALVPLWPQKPVSLWSLHMSGW